MELKINNVLLQQIITRLLDKVCGCCSRAGVTIGEVDGKEIYLSVTDDNEEKSGLNEQHKCIDGGPDPIKEKLLHLMDGLDNCIASAKLNGDKYGEGYMSAMAKELKDVFVSLFGEMQEEEESCFDMQVTHGR